MGAWFVVVCLFALPALAASAGTKNCTVQDLQHAQKVFGERLKLNATRDWHHPLLLFQGIQNFYANDAENGLRDVCNAFNSLLDDLNNKDVNPSTCFEPRFLLTNDDTPEHALHYLSVVGYLRFQCGSGFYAAASSWKCISEVFKSSATQLYNAVTLAVKNTDKTWDLRRCELIKEQERKYYKPFQDHCNRGPVTYFACESYNRFFSTVYTECRSECKIPHYQAP